MKVSILMLTHNAPFYVMKSINSLTKTKNVDYELIVVDNASHCPTKFLLKMLQKKGRIDKLHFNKKNDLFAKGNNIASGFCSDDSDMILLLNSDVDIKSDNWLEKLIQIHPKDGGISAYGAVLSEPVRADGYCMLIDKYLYMKYQLDENFAWWWSVTKLESLVLKENKKIIAVENHEKYIHHYGGKSGNGFKNAAGIGIDIEEVKKWFESRGITVLNTI